MPNTPGFLSGILPGRRPRRREREDGTMTAEALKRLREQANVMQAQAGTFEPIHSPWQGVNKLAQAAVGGMLDRKLQHEEAQAAEREQRERAAAMRRLTEAMQPPAPQVAPGAAPLGDAPPAAGAPGAPGGYDWLFERESGGDMGAMNSQGYGGRAQFGPDRLQDAIAAGIVPEGTTPDTLVQYPDMQPGLEEWHFGDLEQQVDEAMASGSVPAEIAGIPVTREGLVAVAHLGGAGGMRQLLISGGEYNPTDVNGTSLLDYLALGAQHAGAPAAPAAPQPTGPDLTAVMAALSDPALDEQTRRIALAMLPQMMPDEPASPIDLGPGHHLVDPATGETIYEHPMEPGGPVTEVNVGNQMPYGDPRPGERVVLDEQGNPVRIEPIPGGELAREEEEKEQQEAARMKQLRETAGIVTDAAGAAADLVEKGGWLSAGPLGGVWSETGMSEVDAHIQTIRSNVALDKLMELKASGATLGQVSEKEIDMLADSLSKISAYMPPEVLHENLTFIRDTYQKILDEGLVEPGTGEGTGEPQGAPEVETGAAAGDAEALQFPAELDGIELNGRSAREIWGQLTPEAQKQLLADLGAL